MKKPMPHASRGRLGGLARSANLSPAERREAASAAARNKWADMTPEQRAENTRKMVEGRRRWIKAKQAAKAQEEEVRNGRNG